MTSLLTSGETIRQILIESVLSARQLREIPPKKEKRKLGQLLVERGIITPHELATVLALQLGIPCVDPSTYQIRHEVLQLISEAIARKYNVIPLAITNNSLKVAMADANDPLIVEALSTQTRMRIEPAIAVPEDIQRAIERHYREIGEEDAQFNIALSSRSTTEEEVWPETGGEVAEEIPYESEGTTLETAAVAQECDLVQEPMVVDDSPLDLSLVNLNTSQIQAAALQLIPEAIARKYNVIPLAITNNGLQVAMADADDVLTLEALMAWAQMRIEPVTAAAEEIQKAIDRNYKAYGEIEKQFRTASAPPTTTQEKAYAGTIAGAPVVRGLDLIIDEAIKNRASDIHIEPQEDRLRLRYRIDGVLHNIASLPLSTRGPLISRLKILANMNIADRHRPQDGQFSVKARDKEVDVRVATVSTAYGEMGVLRILDKSFAALSLGELGFSPSNLAQYQNMLRSPFGMMLISGPTGSGKTTTLYASVNSLDCEGRNIITIEDPIEYRFKDINQIQVNPRAGFTFAAGLRAIMRHDPDVILVGEIRDPETAEIAVQSALTGHLVLASVHANDTVGSLFRLLDLGVPLFLISSALVGCVAQRMVRRVCPHCRHLSPAPVEAELAYSEEMGEEKTEFFYGTGCNSCSGTGYLGRAAVFEILHMSDEIRRLLLTGAGADQIRAQAKQEGLVSMWHDGMLKVKAGITTPCEVLRNVFSIG